MKRIQRKKPWSTNKSASRGRLLPAIIASSLWLLGDLAQAAPLPKADWRAIPAQVASITNVQQLQPLLSGGNASLKIEGNVQSGEIWWAIRTPDKPNGKRWMMVFSGIYAESEATLVLAKAPATNSDSIPRDKQFTTIAQKKPVQYANQQQFTFEPEPNTWIQFRLVPPNGGRLPIPLQLVHLALYALEEDKPSPDYWLMVGASLELQAFESPTAWAETINEQYGRDPAHFVLAKGGWTSKEILTALPGMLADHPYAASVVLHVGGNDVTQARPFPGGSDELAEDVTKIVQLVLDSGKQPILGRITFRHYKKPDAMQDESQGSLPYNVAIIDPLIKSKMPAFYDFKRSRGRIDGYDYFLENPQYLGDEIHFTREGAGLFRQLWAEQAASVVYQTLPLCAGSNNCLQAVTLPENLATPDQLPQPIDRKRLRQDKSINDCSNSSGNLWLLLGMFAVTRLSRQRRLAKACQRA